MYKIFYWNFENYLLPLSPALISEQGKLFFDILDTSKLK